MKKDETFNEGFIFNKIHLYLNQSWNWKNCLKLFFDTRLLIIEGIVVTSHL